VDKKNYIKSQSQHSAFGGKNWPTDSR